jgi:hypothetical protein
MRIFQLLNRITKANSMSLTIIYALDSPKLT